jgi:hypothetical protein
MMTRVTTAAAAMRRATIATMWRTTIATTATATEGAAATTNTPGRCHTPRHLIDWDTQRGDSRADLFGTCDNALHVPKSFPQLD